MDATHLAGMVRMEIDQAAAAGDEWVVRTVEVMVMYGVGESLADAALGILRDERTIEQRSDHMWVRGAAA